MKHKKYVEMMKETIEKLKNKAIKTNPWLKFKKKKIKEIVKKDVCREGTLLKIINYVLIIPRVFGRYKDRKGIVIPTLSPIVNRKEGPTKTLENYMKEIYMVILLASTTI